MPERIGIFAIDLLGHGKSDKPNIVYTLDKHLTAIDELIKSIGINNFSIMGNSYGGIVALKYAGMSDGVTNLIIEDIPVFEDEPKIDLLMLKKLMEFDNSEHVMRSTLTGEYWLDTKDIESILVNLKARTLILWGSKDPLVNVKNAVILNKMIEGSVLKVFDGGHMPHYSNAKEIADAVIEFIGTGNFTK
jgi:pimeloyl-ACP methyl ester carboxylesterase